MWRLVWVLFPAVVLSQNPYGPSQLDQYVRLLNSRNLGGFGLLNEALSQGTVRNLGDLDGTPKLQGLPPLPLTHDEVLHQLTSTPPPTTTPATARPTKATMPPPMETGIYAVNTAPEMPPRPEDRIPGKFDDDGVFHPDEEEKLKMNKIQGTKIKEFPEKADQPHEEVNDYESDSFYDDPALRVESRRVVRQQHQAVHKTTNRRIAPHGIRARQINPQQARQQAPPQPRPQFRPAAPQLPPQPQYPSFQFQPRPPATGRDTVLTNLLTEIEEYDDFLEQHRVYKESFPQSSPVVNPYRLLPEGQLPTLPRQIQQQQPQVVQPRLQQPVPPQTQQQFQPIPPVQQPQQNQVPPAPWTVNGANAHAATTHTATEHPLLSIFNLFRVPQAHAAPTLSADGLQIPLVDINQRPLALTGLFPTRR